MIRFLLLLSAAVAVAVGGKSPNADYILEALASQPGVRFSSNPVEDALLDVPGLIAKYNYPYEVHNMITSDGYILEAHRIPHGRDNNNTPDPNKPIVFLMHGLMSSSADYLVLGPGNALGYLLAEAGYDVWLGNARGSYYSRRHVRLNPDSFVSQNFWKFSWDEIGNIDLPTFIDYILDRTGQKKLHYIGHSQGGTTFLVLNSLRPEYNEKFISFQALAPAAFFEYNNNIFFNTFAPLENVIESAAFAMGVGEIFGSNEFITWFATNFCHDDSIFSGACSGAFALLADMEYLNGTMVPIFLGHAPAGASIRQVAHYAQSIRFNTFRRFNYNTVTNLATYGRRTPPEYDLSKITVPTYLHYGLNDQEVHPKDIHLLATKLKNSGLYQVERPTFNHLDFIWSMDVKAALYDRLIGYMKEVEQLNP